MREITWPLWLEIYAPPGLSGTTSMYQSFNIGVEEYPTPGDGTCLFIATRRRTVTQIVSGNAATSDWIDVMFSGGCLDGGANAYAAHYGDAFNYANLRWPPPQFESFVADQPIYLAVVSPTAGHIQFNGGPARLFGWIKLESTSTGIQYAGSAVSYDSGGIVVGTTTEIPEPASTQLVAVYLCGVFQLLRSRRFQH